MKKVSSLSAAVLILGLGLVGCKTQDGQYADESQPGAIANLSPTAGNRARGVVMFTPTPTGVRVYADIVGLSPGKHGFHIHEHGDCSAPDASSAGGHFNPTGAPHGGPHSTQRHVGDFGNIVADETGRARVEFVDAHLKLDGPTSIIGRGVIVHAQADDLTSQPSGNAGGRVACGVIQPR